MPAKSWKITAELVKIQRQASLNKLPDHFSRHSQTYKFMHAYFPRTV